MNRYWKLLHWEISRFGKFYAVLGLVTLVSQFAGVILYAYNYMNNVNNDMYRNSLSTAEYVIRSGKINFTNSYSSFLFEAPIALSAAVLLLYVFLIWYREWFGKNTFAYRLLMLPTSRMNVYLAKISAILLFVLGLVAFQLLILPGQVLVFDAMIPSDFRESVPFGDLIVSHPYLSLLLPRQFILFVLYYSVGLMGVLVIFTAILLERSYRIKGMIAGIIYGILAVFLFVSPMLITESSPNYFYPSEAYLMEVIAGIMIISISLWFSAYLLQKKITV